MDSLTESEMLARCLEGDSAGWDQLFDRHYAMVGRFLFQLSYQFSREDTEELCQEVFLSVVKNLRTFQGHCQFQTWLCRIAINKARDFHEKRRAAKRGSGVAAISMDQEDPETGLKLDPPSPLPGPDMILARQEYAELLGKALGQLSEPCREIVELRYFADLSYEELGKALQLNLKTVSSRLSKCLDKLEVLFRTLLPQEPVDGKLIPSQEKKATTPV